MLKTPNQVGSLGACGGNLHRVNLESVQSVEEVVLLGHGRENSSSRPSVKFPHRDTANKSTLTAAARPLLEPHNDSLFSVASSVWFFPLLCRYRRSSLKSIPMPPSRRACKP